MRYTHISSKRLIFVKLLPREVWAYGGNHQLSPFTAGGEQTNTGLSKRVVPRLRESLLLTPSGRRGGASSRNLGTTLLPSTIDPRGCYEIPPFLSGLG